MSLPAAPPTHTASRAPIGHGSRGWPVYAVQTALNALGAKLLEDGVFGDATVSSVRSFQVRMGVQNDGIVGPTTKRLLTEQVASRLDREQPALPDNFVRELCRAEGGDNICAINEYDPPGGTAGTDCGIVQLRCLEPYDRVALMRAFDPYAAMLEAARRFSERKAKYLTYGWTRNNRVRAERCALMAHNWPVGANDIAFEGQLSRPDDPAAWVPAGVRMLDGTVVNTRQEWCDFYAMGTSPHCGAMASRIRWGV